MRYLSAIVLACVVVAQSADPLPRRGYFGVGLEKSANGVRVFSVAPGSTAFEAGVMVGDVIVSVDDAAIAVPEAVTAAVGRRRAGDTIAIGVERAGERRTIQARLKTYPFESMKNATMHYASVESLPGVRLRTIVSVPADGAGRFPAVLLVQGGGCGSIDTPFGTPEAQPGLMHAIGSRGFVTMRVEKSGVGDSQGEPCAAIGYREEVAGYRAALAALRAHPSVDRERVYLVGISLGGVFAPVLAAETPVAGIVVYGTPAGPPPPYPGRSDRFFAEFAAVDVTGAWAKVNTRVLVLHGEYDDDPVVSRAAHESIAARVNAANPGSAVFRELARLDHGWTRHASLEASRDKVGRGEAVPDFPDAVLEFLTTTSDRLRRNP